MCHHTIKCALASTSTPFSRKMSRASATESESASGCPARFTVRASHQLTGRQIQRQCFVLSPLSDKSFERELSIDALSPHLLKLQPVDIVQVSAFGGAELRDCQS